jgi:hypothetical protein
MHPDVTGPEATAADLHAFVGEWELAVDLPGAEGVRGQVLFEQMGEVLLQRTRLPSPDAPGSCSIVISKPDGGYVQHYFDARGVARIYAMTFDGRTWVLQRSEPDFSPLAFHQRFIGRFSDDRSTIDGEWQTSADGREWSRDFGLTYTRTRSDG